MVDLAGQRRGMNDRGRMPQLQPSQSWLKLKWIHWMFSCRGWRMNWPKSLGDVPGWSFCLGLATVVEYFYHLLPLTVVHLSIFIPNIWYLVKEAKIANTFVASSLTKGLKKRPQVWECHGMHILGLFQPSMPSRAAGGVSNRKLRNCAWKGWTASGTGTGLEDLEEVYGIYRHLLVNKKGICWFPKATYCWNLEYNSSDNSTSAMQFRLGKRRSSVLRCPQDLRKSYKATKNRHMPTKGWSFQQQAEMIWMLKIPERAMESRDKMGG